MLWSPAADAASAAPSPRRWQAAGARRARSSAGTRPILQAAVAGGTADAYAAADVRDEAANCRATAGRTGEARSPSTSSSPMPARSRPAPFLKSDAERLPQACPSST